MKELSTLYIIAGAPRSGTTYLHDCLISNGFFKGIVAEPMEHESKALQTNEYNPSLKPAVLYPFDKGKQEGLLKDIKDVLQTLTEEFATADGVLMLKAPHYSYCVDAYLNALGDKVRFLYIERDILDVAVSMSKHPLISVQLNRVPKRCGDFFTGRIPFRKCTDLNWVHPVVMEFAQKNWNAMTVIERAFIKWHGFKRAFSLSSSMLASGQYGFVNYPEMATPSGIEVISRLFDLKPDLLKKAMEGFHPTPPKISFKDISDVGREFKELCQAYVDKQ
jgi:hypothetical protein